MVGASYAAVPLYNWFCRTTGFGGTTQVATAAPERHARPHGHRALRRQRRPRPAVALRARAEFDRGQARRGRDRQLPRHQSGGARPITASAAYNVAPLNVGAYFKKINCFCFTEQTPQAGEKRDMAVVFYVDPALAKDPEQRRPQHHHAVLHVLSAARAVAAGGGSARRPANSSRRDLTERRPKWPTRTPSRTTTTTSSIRARGRSVGSISAFVWRSARSPGCTTCSRRRRWCSASA